MVHWIYVNTFIHHLLHVTYLFPWLLFNNLFLITINLLYNSRKSSIEKAKNLYFYEAIHKDQGIQKNGKKFRKN